LGIIAIYIIEKVKKEPRGFLSKSIPGSWNVNMAAFLAEKCSPIPIFRP